MINDLTPEQVAEGRRQALTVLGAVTSDDDQVISLAGAMVSGANPDALLAGAYSLLIEVIGSRGDDLAEWITAKQDELAALKDD